jgi:Spy/CpxP family protein refolding chaperone
MLRKILIALMLTVVMAGPALGAEPERPRPPIPEELSDAWERFQRALQEWGGRLWERFGTRGSREDRPVISLLLNNKDLLGLTTDQVRRLEQLRDNFQRLTIRNDADLRIIELDIAALFESDSVDMGNLEHKVREGEKLRADVRIARARAIEQAKALLTAEQKRKLQDLNRQPMAPRSPRAGQNPSATEREPPSP